MTKRVISFEVDEEVAGHFNALVEDWKKDPVWLARRFFEEEVLANTSGRRGVPILRRYWHRDPNIYFTAEELKEREAESERTRDPVAEAERAKEMESLFAKINKTPEGRA